MATTSTATDFVGSATTNATIAYNPSSTLDKDSFLKLLMTQLKYQDPTSPMDTDKMLAQTADMAVIESQANIQKEMENMVSQFKQTSAYQLIGAVGKLADTGLNAVKFEHSGTEYKDVLYFEESFKNGLLVVTDSSGNEVRTINLSAGVAGLTSFTWDGKDDSGDPVTAGTYLISANYTGEESGKAYETTMGVYPIDSVVLDQTTPQLLLGGEYYTLDEIVAIKERP